jgi:hypothetical protein
MISFLHSGLRQEFDGERTIEGYKIHPELRKIIFTLAGYIQYRFQKDLVITEILRDKVMQDRYYRDNPKYRANPWKSVHQFGCGVDIRSYIFKENELVELVNFVNRNFSYDAQKSHQVALCHDIGWGKHIHLQVSPELPG